jgi:hypothetical protein
MRKNWLKSGWMIYWPPFAEEDEILQSYSRIAARAESDPALSKLMNSSARKVLDAAGFDKADSLMTLALAVRDRIRSIETDDAIHFVFQDYRVYESDSRTKELMDRVKLLRPKRDELERLAGANSPELAAYVIPLLRASDKIFRSVVSSFALLGVVSHRWGPQTRCQFCYRTAVPGKKTCKEHVVHIDGKRRDNERRHAKRALDWLAEHREFGYFKLDYIRDNPELINDLLHAQDVPAHFSTTDPRSSWTSAASLKSLVEELNNAPRVARLLGRRPVIPSKQVQWLREGLDPDCVDTSLSSWTDKIRIAEEWLEAIEKTKHECRRGRPASKESKADRQLASKLLRGGTRISEVARRLKRNRSTIKTWIDRKQIKVS